MSDLECYSSCLVYLDLSPPSPSLLCSVSGWENNNRVCLSPLSYQMDGQMVSNFSVIPLCFSPNSSSIVPNFYCKLLHFSPASLNRPTPIFNPTS
ncbi:uncharacterized protein ASCRUDRAFT_74650 [Ascoidea rubescens DSM 1968]|uniref:Uncharacterized protein n=1 Tax=Ascoidea rubescens DSM 1968 TaxID=1344418 RepID=A0A1D2VKT7_9ASCO|nr:hypothetical protein ASCRUDRAFT_74650 [Ascoidea rubescens DSM 1968]ODV62220.1 hypothetical protein ASCRUDRAFT_74650 [Ascoidea rubescens DSM 1968]